MGSSVFVSYARENEEFVLTLVNDLRSQNIAVWVDQHDILPGQKWDMAIEEALSQSSHFLFVMSNASVNSQNVRDELDFALEAGKIIIPILLDDCNRPLRIRRIQYIDFRMDYIRALDHLMTLLKDQNATLTVNREELSEKLYDFSGLWAHNSEWTYGRLEVMFLKQKGNVIIGFYDRGHEDKLGIYVGELENSVVLKYKWMWLDRTLNGAGYMIFSPFEKRLTQHWWFTDQKPDDTNQEVFRYLSDKPPAWFQEGDFERYKDSFELLAGYKVDL